MSIAKSINPNNITRIFIATGLVLLVPLIAMIFTDEVQWGPFDFIIIGLLLIGSGLLYELIIRNIKDNIHKTAIGIVIIAAVLLIWAELAVGIFGSPIAGS